MAWFEANGHDASEAIRSLKESDARADTLPEIDPDAELRDLALAYANLAAAQHERIRLQVRCLEALHADNSKLGLQVMTLSTHVQRLERELAGEREISGKRHSEVVSLLKNLTPYQ